MPPHQHGLVGPSRLLPLLQGGVVAGRDVAVHGRGVQAVLAGQTGPVQVGPRLRAEQRQLLWRGLGAELGDESNRPGPAGRELLQIPLGSLLPAQPEMGVGPVQAGKMGEHTGIGHHRTGGVSPLEITLDAPVQHRQVPTRPLVRGQAPGHAQRTLARSVGAVAQGVDMAAPQHHAGVGADCADSCSGTVGGCIPAALGERPDEGEILPDQHSGLVGRVIQRRRGHMAEHPDQVQPCLFGQLHVAAQAGFFHLRPPGGGRTEAGSL